MSGADVDVAVRLGLQDQATPGIDRAAQRAAASAKKTTSEVEAGNNRQRSSYEKTSYAREMLGVRSEQRIQREIQQTEAAYERLMRSAKMTAGEQARALDATRAKVTALTNEMGKLTKAQEQTERGAKALQMGGIVAAGGAAAAYALANPIKQAMTFDERLAHMSNTAFRERDVAGRKLGMNELRTAIDKAQQSGGGTRDGAAEALDSMIASGAMSPAQAVAMLPHVTKAASAANADPTQLANIGIRAMQTFKIKPKDMPNVLNMALAAGQAGGFELKDMSKWLPQQMAAATMSGLSGKEGFAKLAALNQASAITAGSKDEAGNNVVNLLSKINSQDTANDAKKLGINLPEYLQKKRAQGVDSVDAFGELVSNTVSKRADYQELQKKLKNAGGDGERRDALEGMTTIAQGAGIGKLIQDRQALMALLGMMNNKAYMQDVLKEVRANDVRNGGATDKNFDLISGTGAYRARQREEAVKAAEQQTVGGGPFGKVNDAIASMAQKFPELTGGASLAATALVAAAGGAGIFAMATGGGAVGGGAIARTAGKYLPAGKTLLRGSALGVGAMAGGAGLNATFGEESAISRYGSSALNGVATGALIGSVVPVLGTAVGAAVGGVLGVGWEGIKDMLKPSAEAPKMAADIKLSVSDERVRVTSSNVTATGMTSSVQTDTGNLWAMP